MFLHSSFGDGDRWVNVSAGLQLIWSQFDNLGLTDAINLIRLNRGPEVSLSIKIQSGKARIQAGFAERDRTNSYRWRGGDFP